MFRCFVDVKRTFFNMLPVAEYLIYAHVGDNNTLECPPGDKTTQKWIAIFFFSIQLYNTWENGTRTPARDVLYIRSGTFADGGVVLACDNLKILLRTRGRYRR